MRYKSVINALRCATYNAMLRFQENCLNINANKTKLICFRSLLKLPKNIYSNSCSHRAQQSMQMY